MPCSSSSVQTISVLREGMKNMIKKGNSVDGGTLYHLSILIVPNLSDSHFQRMPFSSSSVATLSKKMIENIIRKAIELIVEPSMTCCSQIDSSKFMRAPLEQLLPITKDAHHCK